MGLIPDVMIRPATLNNWLTMGYGVDTFGFNRMVILDVDSQKGYKVGHVPGAYLVEDNNIDLWAARSNGIIESSFQVPTQSRMDVIIRRANIDSDSIVVITGGKMTSISRAYFNFRYWGFPRQQLKVLNGTNATYAAAGFAMQTETPPVPEPCQYSVCSTKGSASYSAVRASFEEMLAVVEDNDSQTIIIDSRSPAEYAGQPGSTLLDRDENEYVAFEGRMRTAVNIDYKTLLIGQSNQNPLIPREDLIRILKKKGIDYKNISFVYGRSGLDDAVLFLALDAELNWPVKIYDGGWSQWGQMAGNSNVTGGMLQDYSPWRTDTESRSVSISYNKTYGFAVESAKTSNSYGKHGDAIRKLDLEICDKISESSITTPVAPGY